MSPSVLALTGTLALYLLGAASLGAGALLGSPAAETLGPARRRVWLLLGRSLAIGAALLHMGAIGLRCAELHRAPFTTPAEALSLLAWLLAIAYLVGDLVWRLAAAGPAALGLSFLLVVLAAGQRGGVDLAHPILSERAVSLHIVAILAAFALFALGSCCAGLYLIERRILKSKHGLIWMKRLPPLLTVERASLSLSAAGFPLLSLGILAGLARATGGGMRAGWGTDPKTLLAYVVWAVYGAYLLARLAGGWPAARASWILLLGLAMSLLAFLVPSAAHRFVG